MFRGTEASGHRQAKAACGCEDVFTGKHHIHPENHPGLQRRGRKREKFSALQSRSRTEDPEIFRRLTAGVLFFPDSTHNGSERLLTFVFAQDTGFNQFVDQLLHGIKSTQKALGRHDDTDVALRSGSLTFFAGLQGDEIETDHVARKVDLTDTVCKNFFFGFHFETAFLCFLQALRPRIN